MLFKVFLYIFTFILLISPVNASDVADLAPVSVKINEGSIIVNASLKLSQNYIEELNQGISKEITFYIDLFRVWTFWPNEFIKGVKIIRTMKTNPIKREYISTSQIGNVITEKRFKDLNSMIDWATSISDLSLTNTKEHEQGTYFVKVSVESRFQKIPPIVGLLLFFIPDSDIKVSKNSDKFLIK
ncbi:MAG TPA: DUF4390 domain-containing protein [Nitrospirae bacterium]|nr:DUF4390 domain-containing protein [Nitrospirota bacterium]